MSHERVQRIGLVAKQTVVCKQRRTEQGDVFPGEPKVGRQRAVAVPRAPPFGVVADHRSFAVESRLVFAFEFLMKRRKEGHSRGEGSTRRTGKEKRRGQTTGAVGFKI